MNRLLNKPFHSMHRVLDMLCLNFGNDYRKIVSIGKHVLSDTVYPTHSLHLQTQWRFVHDDKILLGSRDIYKPYSNTINESEWDYSITDRPDNESSLFDILSKQLSQNLFGHYVTQCEQSPLGDIRITFSNGYVFEVFIPASYQDEEWRLIDFSEDEHLIFYDVD